MRRTFVLRRNDTTSSGVESRESCRVTKKPNYTLHIPSGGKTFGLGNRNKKTSDVYVRLILRFEVLMRVNHSP